MANGGRQNQKLVGSLRYVWKVRSAHGYNLIMASGNKEFSKDYQSIIKI